ncbi:YitT family protein [Prodigiosinella confusarubida]|uniref:YitT family protein n=1 Tax=Serratia sp. (strain ATCC 39006) TaxID=104623 RepID=A0A2I5TCT5_SERS3|nr:YitT family protein [Serratia sp. ATCC 39006]AUH06691.1 YitT family protein [Serratia sp. ATCC 39006]
MAELSHFQFSEVIYTVLRILRTVPDIKKKSATSHTLKDDIYGLALGVLFIAVGLNMLKLSGMITGGIAGIALLISYFIPLPIGIIFIIANIPFMIFCYFSMGKGFTLKTLLVNIALSILTQAIPHLIVINYIHPLFSALVGGTFIGMGILSLARHNASVGGTGAITLWLYKRFNINAGKTQMLLDVLVFLVSLAKMPAMLLFWSAISALAMNAMLMNWHKPGRYQGSSEASEQVGNNPSENRSQRK